MFPRGWTGVLLASGARAAQCPGAAPPLSRRPPCVWAEGAPPGRARCGTRRGRSSAPRFPVLLAPAGRVGRCCRRGSTAPSSSNSSRLLPLPLLLFTTVPTLWVGASASGLLQPFENGNLRGGGVRAAGGRGEEPRAGGCGACFPSRLPISWIRGGGGRQRVGCQRPPPSARAPEASQASWGPRGLTGTWGWVGGLL